jgi:carbonic anhydrase/acetyltransferase-like protein (isoleucine patch superfamily)
MESTPGQIAMRVAPHHGVSPRIHPSVFVAEGVCVLGDVEIGIDASIWFNSVLRGDINLIRIGDRTNVQDGSIFHVTSELPVIVGNDVTVGHRAIVHGCTVGDGSLIGMGAIVLDRARIGKQALVAAGAVVREGFEVPDGMLAAGVPAKITRALTGEEKQALLESARHYVEYAKTFRGSPTSR